MKKFLIYFLIAACLFMQTACGDDDTPEVVSDASSSVSLEREDIIDLSPTGSGAIPVSIPTENSIETTIKNYINAIYHAEIDSFTLMEDRSTPAEGDYKVYTIVEWDGTDGVTETAQTLQSETAKVAGNISPRLEMIQEITLVWMVPNLDGRAKITYSRVDGILELSDESYNNNLTLIQTEQGEPQT